MRWHLLGGEFRYTDTGLLDATHLRFFTYRTFQELARTCGFNLLEVKATEANFPGSGFLARDLGLPRLSRSVVDWLLHCAPNLVGEHFIYRLGVTKEGDAGGEC
jgi:hypothetical protein